MASNYPASLDTTATLPAAAGVGANLSTFPHSTLTGNVNDAVIAIETELGTAPSGTFSTVKARLDTLIVPDVQVFTSNGTWTKPTGVTVVQVTAIGGGGGGGSGRRGATSTIRGGGSGGGGGQRVVVTMPASVCAATEAVVIGTGGAGGVPTGSNDTNGNPGITGTVTTFGGLVIAAMGAPGSGGSLSATTGGGLSGTRLVDGNTGEQIGGGHGGKGQTAGTPVQPDSELLVGGGGGGGGGGGADAANVSRAGGQGGNRAQSNTGGGAGGAVNNPGLAGTASTTNLPMGGAGGGGAGVTAAGGAGALYGGGGGGAGATTNGTAGQSGGAGAAGIVVVISS